MNTILYNANMDAHTSGDGDASSEWKAKENLEEVSTLEGTDHECDDEVTSAQLALNNTLVLTNLFSKFQSRELYPLRLVNKNWNREILLQVRPHDTIIMKHVLDHLKWWELPRWRRVNRSWNREITRRMKNVPQFILVRSAARARRLMENYRTSPNFPFTRARLEMSPQVPEEDQIWNDFLHLATHWITEAVFTVFSGRPIPEGIAFPHLTTCVFEAWRPTDRIPDILSRCPSLSRLSIEGPNEDLLHQLAQINTLRLSSVGFSIDGNEVYRAFLQFLQRQKDSLVELSIRASRIQVDLEEDRANLQLPSLQCLSIEERQIYGDWLLGEPTSYHSRYPALRELWFNLEDLGFQFTGQEVLSVEKMKIIGPGGFLNYEEDMVQPFFDNAPKTFPNVKTLVMYLKDDFRNETWKFVGGFKRLEEFEFFLDCSINQNFDVNAMFTGLTWEEAQRVQGMNEQQFGIAMQEFHEKPQFTALNQLKVLRYETTNGQINDLTCKLVFMQLEKVKMINFLRQESIQQVSETMMNKMKEKFEVISEYYEERWGGERGGALSSLYSGNGYMLFDFLPE